jgi:hypothetical protein
MALLKPTRVGTSRALLLASAAGLAGCFLADLVGTPLRTLEFSHRLHVEDQGLDCTDCHAGAEDSDEPGMPAPLQCALCHEDLDAEKPPELKIATLFVDGKLRAEHASALPDEVIFSHLLHVSTGQECAACHGKIEESDGIGPEVAVDMDECMSCHASRAVANECTTCHSQLSQDRPPPSHDLAWREVHGSVVRARSTELLDDCYLCHSESSCATCHEIDPPQDHTNYWRRRGHAFSAAFDRDRCAACHQPDACNRCHEQALPLSHAGSWGGTLSNHCLSCHFPLRREGCVTCHKGTPSHALAPPKPPDHFAGMDCRQCHGLSAPLPHVDNGSDCNICHG